MLRLRSAAKIIDHGRRASASWPWLLQSAIADVAHRQKSRSPVATGSAPGIRQNEGSELALERVTSILLGSESAALNALGFAPAGPVAMRP